MVQERGSIIESNQKRRFCNNHKNCALNSLLGDNTLPIQNRQEKNYQLRNFKLDIKNKNLFKNRKQKGGNGESRSVHLVNAKKEFAHSDNGNGHGVNIDMVQDSELVKTKATRGKVSLVSEDSDYIDF